MNNKIFFLILNYNTVRETEICIRTIHEMDKVALETHIIVVDNGSTDGTIEKLGLLEAEDVTVLYLKENRGFSYGNNIGYEYIRKLGGAAFIVVCNSDIEFRDKRFLKMLLDEYKRSKFEILGMDIYCESQRNRGWKGHQSPAYPWERKEHYVKFQIRQNQLYKKNLLHSKTNIPEIFQKVCYKGIGYIYSVLTRVVYRKWRLQYQENVVVHGSCFVLADKFLRQEDKIFFPETEFYFEEMLLYLRVKENGYKSVYNPEIKVWHMQGQATKRRTENQNEQKLFVADHLIKSGKIYLDELHRRNDEGKGT